MRDLMLMAMRGARDIVHMQRATMNNLANASTDGFRAELARFVPLENGASRPATVTDFSAGPVRSTGNSLDLAISGDGWFAVQDADGELAYSRRGDLRVDELERLVNGSGLQLMGDGGPIQVPPHGAIEIAGDGTVSILPLGEQANSLVTIDRLRLVKPEPGQLVRSEDGLFRALPGEDMQSDASVGVVSGALEGSNVNAVESLVEMIDLARRFEAEVNLMKEAKDKQEQMSRLMSVS